MFNKKRIQELEDMAAEQGLLFDLERKALLEKLEEANKKLLDFMDITRKEALDSYRKGLQDGLNIQVKNAVPEAPYQPVKSMIEHEHSQQAQKENDKITKGLMNILNFDGTPQKDGDED